jgi:predicted nucleic acid-binding protein
MAERALVDSGFLVALLNRTDAHHEWAAGLVPTLRGPWLTAEACISEAVFLLEQAGRVAVEALLRWLEQGALVSQHCLPEQLTDVRTELFGYRSRWVDFADACLVILSDEQPKLPVVSVDSADFSVYFRRRSGRRLILPPKRR